MKRTVVPSGRLDALAEAMIEAGLKANGDPTLRIAARMAKPHITQALTESIGPGTKAGEVAQKIVAMANEFWKRFLEARRQIQAEDQ